MDLTPERILDYLTNSLSPADRLAVETEMARSPSARLAVHRLSIARATVREDCQWVVPSSAIEAACALGERLARRREPSLFQRFSLAIGALVADLTFDSRVEGALAGLRGASGFALAYACNGVDIELECSSIDDDDFAMLGQIAAEDGRAFARVEAFAEAADTADVRRVTTAAVSADGMFRLSLPSGSYLLRFHEAMAGAAPIDVASVEVP